MCSCVNWPRQSRASWSAHNGRQVVLRTEAAQGRGLSPGHHPPSNEEELEPRGQEKRRVSRPHLPHTSGDWKIWSGSPSIRAIKKVISPLPWKPKTEMWKEGNPFPCGYILMWLVPLVKNEGPLLRVSLDHLQEKGTSVLLQGYLMIKIGMIFFSFFKETCFLFCLVLLSPVKPSAQMEWADLGGWRVKSNSLFSFLSMAGLWQEVKYENINNGQFVLDSVCVKIRISVSVLSLFRHVWVFW